PGGMAMSCRLPAGGWLLMSSAGLVPPSPAASGFTTRDRPRENPHEDPHEWTGLPPVAVMASACADRMMPGGAGGVPMAGLLGGRMLAVLDGVPGSAYACGVGLSVPPGGRGRGSEGLGRWRRSLDWGSRGCCGSCGPGPG